jgi:hypothetical protein
MANYNKSFNFRNGVQVDDDNFIVNANGLVGIGTSIPREFLDVYGTAKVTGLVTTTNLAVTGVSTFYSDVKVGSAITFNSSTGAVSATAFFGDGGNLLNVEQVAVNGWIVTAGTISTAAKVGIGTTLPYYSLQVGLDPITGNGLSIDAITGNVNTTGIITANRFSGPGDGVTDLNASVITSGTLNNSRLPQNINVSGIVTAYSFTGFGTNLQGINATNITNGTLNNSRLPQNISISGIITANSGIITLLTNTNLNNTGIATLGVANASRLLVSGITTSTGGFVGNVTGTATTATSLTGSPNITVGNITSSNINSTGIITSSNINNTGIITSSSIISQSSSTGVSTVSTRLYAESIGVGTNSPSGDIHIRRSSSSTLQVTSDNAEAIVAVGRSTTLTGNNGALIFGNTAGIYPYSDSRTLDIVNYSTGSLNYYLNYSGSGGNNGDFNWIYGPDATNPLMTLTYGGNLGIGVTNPTKTFEVFGTSSFVGISSFNDNVNISNDLIVNGNLTVNGSFSVNSIIATLLGNVNTSSGISTFNNINAIGDASSFRSFIGIGTQPSNPAYSFEVLDTFAVSSEGVGIGTNITLPGFDVTCTGPAVFGTIGIGTDENTGTLSQSLQVGSPSVVRGAYISGNLGVGVTNPADKLTVRGGDISVGINTSNGLVLTSANGTKYRLFVSNAGVLSTVLVP